LIVLEWIM